LQDLVLSERQETFENILPQRETHDYPFPREEWAIEQARKSLDITMTADQLQLPFWSETEEKPFCQWENNLEKYYHTWRIYMIAR
jgi:hypothetical protein